MKRLLIALSILIVLSLLGIYLFIPGNITISKIALINCNEDAAKRILLQPSTWKKWWINDRTPQLSKSSVSGNYFIYNKTTFTIANLLHNSVNITIKNNSHSINSTINILPLPNDSIAIQWNASIAAGLNPVKRIQDYQNAVFLKKNMTDILSNLSSFLEKREVLYGIRIQKTSTTDTILVATKSVSPDYPATPVIYRSIKMLQEFIAKKGAKQTGAPMMNVSKLNSSEYQYMVAVPTNVPLKDEGNIFLRKMVKGNFLAAEVRGGFYTINQAMNNMQLYISDYKKTSMAIPFQSLITDRSKEADTSKWITKIYFPIYY